MTFDLRIGTAGWTIPAAVADRFPPSGTHLERYGRGMNTAEVNTSFYRPHRRTTWERWAASTPFDFRFAVKVPRLLTHDQRLVAPEAGLDRFAGEVSGLGHRLGVLLVQLPPNLGFESAVAGAFFAALRERFEVPVALEPRHADWFGETNDAWLREREIARVAADPARHPGAERPGGWRGLTYYRLHGSPRVYYSAYAPGDLAEMARTLTGERRTAPVWCVFDNTAASAALGDALTVVDAIPGGADGAGAGGGS